MDRGTWQACGLFEASEPQTAMAEWGGLTCPCLSPRFTQRGAEGERDPRVLLGPSVCHPELLTCESCFVVVLIVLPSGVTKSHCSDLGSVLECQSTFFPFFPHDLFIFGVLGLRCCAGLSVVAVGWGLLSCVVLGLLSCSASSL